MTIGEQIAKQAERERQIKADREQLAEIKEALFMHTHAAAKVLGEYKADPDTPPKIREMAAAELWPLWEVVKDCDLAKEYEVYINKAEDASTLYKLKEKAVRDDFIWYINERAKGND